MNDPRYKGPADPTTPCDACSGPTYTFPSGSIWCPNNECYSGAHFVKRVAFERAPGAEPKVKRGRKATKTPTPIRAHPQPQERTAWNTDPERSPAFSGGYDDFLSKEKN